MSPVGWDEGRVARVEAKAEIIHASIRDGAGAIAENRGATADLRDRVVKVETFGPRIDVLEAAAKPTPWHGKGGLIALILWLATIGVGVLKLPTRDDQEKAVGALVAVDAAIRLRTEELALRNERLAAELKAAGEAIAGLQREAVELRRIQGARR